MHWDASRLVGQYGVDALEFVLRQGRECRYADIFKDLLGLAGPDPLDHRQGEDTAHRFQVSLHRKNSTPFLISSQVE